MALVERALPVTQRPPVATAPRSLSASWLVAVGVVLHLILAVSAGLSPDEAHYALYGAHPDWSYFDHPPLVGWLQAPFVAAGGDDWLMRVVPMASWLIAVWLMIGLCRELPIESPGNSGPRRRDAWVVLLLLLSPMLDLLGVALVPDTLLMPLVPAVMSATWRLRTPEQASKWRRWFVLSVLLGLCMLTKYTGLFVVLGALLSLCWFHGRKLLHWPGPWLTAMVVVAMASPVVTWNIAHHWASFVYQSAHAAGDQDWQLRSALRAAVLQFALYGLLLPIGVVRGLRAIACQAPGPAFTVVGDARTLGLAFGVPVLLVFVAMAGRGSSLPHWTACGWVALIPLALDGALRLGRTLVAGLILWHGVLLGAILVLVLMGGLGSETGSAAISPAGMRSPEGRANPVADVYGWEAAAQHGAGLAEQRRARGLVVMNWSLASRLAWYARPMSVFVAPERMDQFQLWFGALQPGDSVVAMDWSQMPLAVPIGPDGFTNCTPISQLATAVDGRQIAHFNYLYCEGWHGGTGAGAMRPDAAQRP
jgi:4-amino-4-deoxy-L-arabinose transferase-like glycosyltransferase